MRIVTAHTRLRHRFIGIERLEDRSSLLGRHGCVWLSGIHKDLGQADSLEISGWPILFIDRPIADQPVPQSVALCRNEPPCFDQELGW